MTSLAKVAISGLYGDLEGLPGLSKVAISGDYNDLFNTPAPNTDPYAYHTGTVQTTNNTTTTIITFTPADNKTTMVKADVIGYKTGGAKGFGQSFALTFRKTSGTITQVLQPAVPASSTASDNVNYATAWTISGSDLLLQVTGDTSETIDWYAVVQSIEIT